jgi:hypothetical protein
MKDSFHCDEKTVFFDFVILMSDKTMKEIRFIRKIRRQKGLLRTANGTNLTNGVAAWSFARRMGEGVFLKHE